MILSCQVQPGRKGRKKRTASAKPNLGPGLGEPPGTSPPWGHVPTPGAPLCLGKIQLIWRPEREYNLFKGGMRFNQR